MWMHGKLLVSFLAAYTWAATVREPVGLVNKGNYCYVSSVLQAFYHIPAIRRAILQYQSNSVVHATLASLFYRLTVGTKPQEMDVDFFAAVEKTSNGFFEAGATDDAQAFLSYLVGQHLPWVGDEFLTFEVEETSSYEGINFGSNIAKETSVIVPVLENITAPVHHGLADTAESVEFVINPAEYAGRYEKSAGDAVEEDRVDLQTKFLRAGISQKTQVSITRTRKIIKTPPIIVLVGNKYRLINNAANADGTPRKNIRSAPIGQQWDGKNPTLYEKSFEIHGKKYHLYSTVVFQPGVLRGSQVGGGHFLTHTCVDPIANQWYILNDSGAALAKQDEELGNDPFIFFYVEESMLKQWTTEPPFSVDSIPLIYRVLGQLYQSVVDGVHMMMGLTSQPFPSDEPEYEPFIVPEKIVTTFISNDQPKDIPDLEMKEDNGIATLA